MSPFADLPGISAAQQAEGFRSAADLAVELADPNVRIKGMGAAARKAPLAELIATLRRRPVLLDALSPAAFEGVRKEVARLMAEGGCDGPRA